MAVTASKLKALIEVDNQQGVTSVRAFSTEMKKAAAEADKDAKQIGDSLSKGTKEGAEQAKREVLGLSDIVKGAFAGNALWDSTKGIFAGVAEMAAGAVAALKGVLGEALESIRTYESLSMSLTQLTATQLVQNGVTEDMGEALTMAAAPAKDLIAWVERLAILSPFESDDINSAVQMAMGFQFSQGEAKRLTEDLVNFVAAAGKSPDTLNRITLSLGQIRVAGKVTGQDLRELANAGLPVISILAKSFGVTTAEMTKMVSDGAVPAVRAIRSIEEYLEKNFKGAAERTANTWNGLLSSLQEAKNINLRELFGGVFEAVKPVLGDVTELLLSDKFKETLRSIGTALGEAVKDGVEVGKKALATMFDSDGLADFMEKIRSGDFNQAIHEIVGRIEFGAMNAISVAKEVGSILLAVGQYVGELLKEFIANLGQLLELFSNVIDAKVTALTARAEAIIRLNASPSYNRAADEAAASSANSVTTLTEYIGKMKGDLAPAYDVMIGKIGAAKAQREEETKSIREQETAYYALGKAKDASAKAANYDPLTGRIRGNMPAGKYDPLTGQFVGGVTKAVGDDAVTKALNGTLESTGSDVGAGFGKAAGKSAVSEMQKELEKGVSKMQSYIDKGINASIGLGKMPGLDQGAPGANGWAENIFRLQDVYAHLGKQGQTEDTVKWYKQWFDGMGFDQAREQAGNIVSQFQRGNMSADVLKYLDLGKLKQMAIDDQAAEDSQANLAKMVGLDPDFIATMLGGSAKGKDKAGKGTVLGPKDAEALAKGLQSDLSVAFSKNAADGNSLIAQLLGISGEGNGAKEKKTDFGGQLVGALATAMEADIKANGTRLKQQGALAWGEIETGFVAKAKSSAALVKAIDGMVDNSIRRYIPAA